MFDVVSAVLVLVVALCGASAALRVMRGLLRDEPLARSGREVAEHAWARGIGPSGVSRITYPTLAGVAVIEHW